MNSLILRENDHSLTVLAVAMTLTSAGHKQYVTKIQDATIEAIRAITPVVPVIE